MSKILLIQRVVSHYNVPVYQKIAETNCFKVAYSEKNEDLENRIETMKISFPTGGEFQRMNEEEFDTYMEYLMNICMEFDAIIIPMEPFKKILFVIERLRKKVKVLLWGIGVAASYDTRYDSIDFRNPSFESMVAMADAAIFYTEYPRNKYLGRGIPKEKMFVALNTVNVLKAEIQPLRKESILFVGTLLKQKRVDLLLECYRESYTIDNSIPALKIIGEGPEFESLSSWIKEAGLEHKVFLKGPIYNEEELKEEFLSSFATISADQAGLSVLKSMGYGVPFITNRNAITGGEIFNIEHDENGLLFDENEELVDIILDISKNRDKYIAMGRKAQEYYYSNATVQNCAEGFCSAIDYALLGGERL